MRWAKRGYKTKDEKLWCRRNVTNLCCDCKCFVAIELWYEFEPKISVHLEHQIEFEQSLSINCNLSINQIINPIITL